jgi:uncharacterized metal-binding protein YceD (DUF177 family)
MDRELPDEIDCTKGIGKTKEWSGHLKLQKFKRHNNLYCIVTDPALRVIIGSQQGRLNIDIFLHVVVEVQCQRCLRPLMIDVKRVGRYVGIEAGANYKDVSKNDEREIVTLFEGKLSLTSLVEEEVLLEIPMIPKHDQDEDCELVDLIEVEVKIRSKKKAFADLASMIKNNN